MQGKGIVGLLGSALAAFMTDKERSLRAISEEVNIPYQRLSRLKEGDLGALQWVEATKLCDFLQNYLTDTDAILRQYYPKEFPDYVASKLAKLYEKFSLLTSSLLTTEIYIYVLNPEFERSAFSALYGIKGQQILDELLSRGVLIQSDNGKFASAFDDYTAPPVDFLKKLSGSYGEICNPNEPGHFARALHFFLNTRGEEKAYGIIAEAEQSLKNLSANPDYAGNRVYLVSLQCGNMLLSRDVGGEP
jgi:hypothetical protein